MVLLAGKQVVTARLEVGGGPVYLDGMALPQIAWKQGAHEVLGS
jgi:hypothetical protein